MPAGSRLLKYTNKISNLCFITITHMVITSFFAIFADDYRLLSSLR